MNHIGLFLKVTHNCNLRCKYCYEAHRKEKEVLSLDRIKKLIAMAAKYFNEIHIMFHGGEPLLAPKEYYEEIFEYCKSFKDIRFAYSMQSNATLIDEEILEMLTRNKVSYSISYDGLSTARYRGPIELIEDRIKFMIEHKLNPGFVAVASDNFLDNIIVEYEHIRFMGLLAGKINPCFDEQCSETEYTQRYIDRMKLLFDYWLQDEKPLRIAQFDDLVNLAKGGIARTICSLECHKAWVGMDADGTLGMCDNSVYPPDTDLGNIDNYEDIYDILFCTRRKEYLGQIAGRYKQCFEIGCELAGRCSGGCNGQRMRTFGNLGTSGGSQCTIIRGLYSHINNRVNGCDTNV